MLLFQRLLLKEVPFRLDPNAIKQLKEKGYAEKYTGKPVHLIGVEFSKSERQIVGFESEAYRPV